MTERFAHLDGDIELCYETFGDPADPTVLLVMGLATQMLAWDERFCGLLVDRGFHVVRYDNRDVGRSSRVRGRPPTVRELVTRDPRAARYTLSDMADDAVGLLDHVGVGRAHVVGASMGGMIAQTLAIEHPERILSLVSIMSNEGGRLKGQPALSVVPTFLRRAPREREAYAAYVAEMYGLIGSPGFARDQEEIKQRARIAHDRGISAAGSGRQLAAVLASPNRTRGLRGIRVPALVIHGTRDRLVNRSGGRAVAGAIPGAELLEIEGMGHDLPAGAWPQIVEGVVRTAGRAQTGLAYRSSAMRTSTSTSVISTPPPAISGR